MSSALTVWHYSALTLLVKIEEDQLLHPGKAGGAEHELPLLWFSANQRWEPTASKMVREADGKITILTFSSQATRFGCIRFGLPATDPRLLPWEKACKVGGISNRQRSQMERYGKSLRASPTDWYAIAGAVPLQELRFELWKEESWIVPPELL